MSTNKNSAFDHDVHASRDWWALIGTPPKELVTDLEDALAILHTRRQVSAGEHRAAVSRSITRLEELHGRLKNATDTFGSITFVAVGPYGWGKGSTVSEAVRNMKKAISLNLCKAGTIVKCPVMRIEGIFTGVSGVDGAVGYIGRIEKVDVITLKVPQR